MPYPLLKRWTKNSAAEVVVGTLVQLSVLMPDLNSVQVTDDLTPSCYVVTDVRAGHAFEQLTNVQDTLMPYNPPKTELSISLCLDVEPTQRLCSLGYQVGSA